ncbi:MAG: ABC transporter ATP-binding protein [Spirochaetes bacterium GWD1_27_9]|nr:MAG: ABC transporter ATP-binding protein [Spirochaetes bacterium GWC1_27_15]OHD37636.1 MAG: ABC transporter ATP-binding protein [Spirochaetes bacterium GWD1_27_9]
MLEVQNIEVKYGNIKALKNISISINEGQIVSLIGANGAGKSTLLKAIVGLEPITNGNISFYNEQMFSSQNNSKLFNFSKKITTDKIVKKGIALVPEGRGVFADMTITENLEMGAFLKTDKTFIKNKIEEMFNIFPILRDRRKQKSGSLSGGEQQMLAIARALMSMPKMILLDEPGLGLAPLVIKDIFEIIKKINKNDGVTVFLVEQNAKSALQLSNRGFVMETGCIIMEDDSKNLLENPKVKSAYLGE